MGGVGKTTMMEQLKKTVEDRKMFDWILKVVIGQKIDIESIQQAVALYMGQPLPENPITARADLLRIGFKKMFEEKKKVLVIFDDVWESFELKDIGLSPLPNGFKLLLTSRYESACSQIAGEANSDINVVRVDVMEELEAHDFFFQITGVAKKHDHDLYQIGCEMVRRCGFLPLAIKLIGTTLKSKEAYLWRDALKRLKKNNLDKNVQKTIEMSYTYIKDEEEKAIFLLCGLFPDDFDIPIEELTRYAWGLQLLNEVSTIGDARDRTKTCVYYLKTSNLLFDSDFNGCVKMHDLVHAFVLGRVSKGDLAWIVNHGDIPKWSRAGMRESCKRISLTCKGISVFPRDFKYPNVSLLRLMHGDRSLRFPEDFYERMENIEVIAYENMQYPLLPRSLECSTKLRTLLLHQCLLMFDCSAIGELLNLEVLSFANCGIRKLPSTIGKLKELKLLDLTGCVNLRIDDGVLINLVKLEELYMKVDKRAIRFTDSNHAELAALSEHLSALEVEFFDNNGIPENMFFMKLDTFKISMGRSLGDSSSLKMHSSENTLVLVTNKEELLKSRMNELFDKTEVLYLEVDGMDNLQEVLVESCRLPQHSFNNLRSLDVYMCANLRYLFTIPVTSGLMKLERLKISDCPVMEVLAYCEDDGVGVIQFPVLKYLSLYKLPNLVGFCNSVNVIELPQLVELRLDGLPNFTSIYPENTSATSSISSNVYVNKPFLKKEVIIPKLDILHVGSMNNLKEIWPYQVSSSDQVTTCMLRKIEVYGCDNIENLFPRNPMWLLRYLEELVVSDCRSIEVLFNIDMTCIGESEEYSSNLRRIWVYSLGKLRELWRTNGESVSDILIRSFQAVEMIEIQMCESFLSVFTPTIINYDVRTLMNVSIDGRSPCEEKGRNIGLVDKSQEIEVLSKEEIPRVYDNGHDVAFPVYRLKRLEIFKCNGVDVVFEIENSSSRDLTTHQPKQPPVLVLPDLKELWLQDMERMTHVWKCNWNQLVIPQNQSQSSFRNLTNIFLFECHNIKYLFSPLMGTLLPNLKVVEIIDCDGIEEVVSNAYDENNEMDTSISTHKNIISFPHLEDLDLRNLPCLKIIDGGNAFKCSQVDVASWFLCQYSKKIEIRHCHDLSTLCPKYVVGKLNKLVELRISECRSMMELFEGEGVNDNGDHAVGDDTCTTMTIPRHGIRTLLELPNLTILHIEKCESLEYIFTSSTIESLKQLKELIVDECKAVQVIVKEIGEHTETSKSLVFPRLKSLTLADLPNLKGFFLGMNEFRWPLLEKVTIYGCPQMMNFTYSQSMAPKLNYIHTGVGKHTLECGLNFHLSNPTHESQLDMCSLPDIIKLLHFPWSFSNLVEVDAQKKDKLLDSQVIFPCNELLNLKNIEKICIAHPYYRYSVEEVFEVVEGTNDDMNETQSVVVFEKLKEMTLDRLDNLTHIWKSNRWIVLNFPNLTKVSINDCRLLGHVFTRCMVGSLLQLQELQISDCESMDVIVKQVEDSDTRSTEVVFPCLKSITLLKLPNIKGFYVGKENFLLPSLDTLEIKDCPQITVFTCGLSTTPKLKLIDTTFGLCHATEDPTSFIKTKQQEGWQF
ncbi:hypothetical protein L1887_06367 [Cichorium endivia]|nr:hypothetical protein L1887_06367 [Cichorium endivia]